MPEIDIQTALMEEVKRIGVQAEILTLAANRIDELEQTLRDVKQYLDEGGGNRVDVLNMIDKAKV